MKNKLLILFLLISLVGKSQSYVLYMIDKNGSAPADSFYLKTTYGVSSYDSVYKGVAGIYTAYARKGQFRYFYATPNANAVQASPLNIANFTGNYHAPQAGTLMQLASSGVTTNARISMDTYNGANLLGSVFQGRRAAGSAANPSAATTNYTLAGLVGDGYGVDSFHNISVGSFLIKADATFTNTSAPTYLSMMTTPSGSTTAAERMRILSTGALKLNSYGSGTFTGTPAYTLQVDASGNIVEGATTQSITLSGDVSGTGTTAITTTIGASKVTNSMLAGSIDYSKMDNATVPTWNQSTTGSAATLTTARKINGSSFDGSADIQTKDNILAVQAGGSPWLTQTLDFPLPICNTSTALVDNTVRFVPVWLPKAATVTGIRVYVRTQGSYTGDNNNKVGLYSYSGGTMTLVASSTNSSSLWTSAANAFQTIAFSSTYSASAGLYFVGLLYNNSAQTTAPTLAGGTAFNNVAMVTYQGTNSIKYFGTLGSSNDLPSSQAMSGVTGVTASYWVALY